MRLGYVVLAEWTQGFAASTTWHHVRTKKEALEVLRQWKAKYSGYTPLKLSIAKL